MASSGLSGAQRRERTADVVARRERGQKWKEIGFAWNITPQRAWGIYDYATTRTNPAIPRASRAPRFKKFISPDCQVPGLFHLLYERRIHADALAKTLGIDGTTVSCWKQGKSSPTLKMLKRLAEHLDVSLDVLVYWRGEGS